MARVRSPARFVAKLTFSEGVVWLSCIEDCHDARTAIQRFLAEGRVSEEGVRALPVSMLVSLVRPVADCIEVHVDFIQGVVKDVRVTRTEAGAIVEEVVSAQF